MAISTDYSAPVRVNGFACRNCSEVDQAKRNIDPANPSAGPFGINDSGKAPKKHFSDDARQQDLMADLHADQERARNAAGQSVAAAYGLSASVGPGNFVNIGA